MKFRRLAVIAVPVAIALGAAGTALPAHAAGSVNKTGHCSGTSMKNLQLQREDPTHISVDFGVDMARHTAGVVWNVRETDNGTVFVNTTRKTISDGSFSITKLITAQPGTNTIVARATNPATGEVCRISASI